jgi:glycosyl transferase family 87
MKLAKILAALLIAAFFLWFLSSRREQIHAAVKDRDSLSYWAAGKLLLHGQNPYSHVDVLALEQDQGYAFDKPLILRTPPWSLWIVLPLGLLSSYWAWVLWLAVLLACLIISMRICWRLYGNGPRPPTIFILIGYLFAPVAGCLLAGQLGLVLLLAFVLFLKTERKSEFLAGVVLVILFAKPHVSALFWPILAIWIIQRKKWLVASGFITALVIATVIAAAFDPRVFLNYREMLSQSSIQHEFIPALSGVVRLIFFRNVFWIQFVPMVIAFGWSLLYFYRNQQNWEWPVHGPALLVISILATPYAWMTDEAILLPAILQGALWVYSSRSNLKLTSQIMVVIFAALDVLLLLILRAKIPFATGIYFWSSLLWAGWYWYAKRFAPAEALA